MTTTRLLIAALMILASATGHAFDLLERDSVLDPREAFIPTLVKDHGLALHWQIAPGYYLYRDKIKIAQINRDGRHPLVPKFEPAERVIDKEFGHQQVYRHATTMGLETLPPVSGQPAYLEITYQGCKEDRLCYPPTTLRLPLPSQPPITESQ